MEAYLCHTTDFTRSDNSLRKYKQLQKACTFEVISTPHITLKIVANKMQIFYLSSNCVRRTKYF